jgi:hypothetical protein
MIPLLFVILGLTMSASSVPALRKLSFQENLVLSAVMDSLSDEVLCEHMQQIRPDNNLQSESKSEDAKLWTAAYKYLKCDDKSKPKKPNFLKLEKMNVNDLLNVIPLDNVLKYYQEQREFL